MYMTDGEILKNWQRAADPTKQVEILADLNAVDKYVMHNKLVELGAEGVPQMQRKCYSPRGALDAVKARQLYDAGKSDAVIAEQLGVTSYVVGKWRRSEGLEAARFRGKEKKVRKKAEQCRQEEKESVANSIKGSDKSNDSFRVEAVSVSVLAQILRECAKEFPQARILVDGQRITGVGVSVIYGADGKTEEADVNLFQL